MTLFFFFPLYLALRALPFLLAAWLLCVAVGAAEDFLKHASVDPAAQAAVLAAVRALRLPRASGPGLARAARGAGAAVAAAGAAALAWRLRSRLPPLAARAAATLAARLPPLRLRWEVWALLGASAALLLARGRRLARCCARRCARGAAAAGAAAPAPAAPPGAPAAPPGAPAAAPAAGAAAAPMVGEAASAAAAARLELFLGIAAAAGLAPGSPAMQAVPARRLLPGRLT
jgi:hypothetical protein